MLCHSRNVVLAQSRFDGLWDLFVARDCALPATQMLTGLATLAASIADDATLLITDSDFFGYPYFSTAPTSADQNNDAQMTGAYDGLARVVAGLARTLTAMAGVVQT